MDAKRARRIFIPLFVIACALGVVATAVLDINRQSEPIPEAVTENASEDSAAMGVVGATDATDDEGAFPAGDDDTPSPTSNVSPTGEAKPADVADDEPAGPVVALDGLRAVAPKSGRVGPDAPETTLGSLDAEESDLLVELTRSGAGIARITLSDYWNSWAYQKQAARHRAAVERGDADPPLMPDDEHRYVLFESRPQSDGRLVPGFAAFLVTVNGVNVNLFSFNTDPVTGEAVYIWAQPDPANDPGRFETVIRNSAGEAVLEITRRFTLHPNGETTGIRLEQDVRNVSGQALDVQWKQYGPSDLEMDPASYMDRRRIRFGYQNENFTGFPVSYVFADADLLVERSNVVKDAEKAVELAERARSADEATRLEYSERLRDLATMWPNDESRDNPYDLSWFAVTNRYFACVVHPIIDEPANDSRSLSPLVEEVRSSAYRISAENDESYVFSYLYSPTIALETGATTSIDYGIFAGPVDRELLKNNEPYASLNFDKLKIYVMSSFCAICTFQWLANILLLVLSFFHDWIWHDWALSIITLVIIVRAMLHPILKKSQISMQRMSRQMSNLKPELDRLKKKYASDPKRMQVEQMRLFREHGVNPLGCLSIVPMMLQTPIWIALYAMLYFAFDLRQEPAFYGVFQMIGNWPFLADLSASDHMLGEFETPMRLLFINVTGINVLPLLMGVMFFFQQKYMSPPPSPNMTKEQMQQQKIMRVMFVVMFPVMLYAAPSGLTLYILTSSSIGILESHYIRRHINEMDLLSKPKKAEPKKANRNPQARAMQKAMEYHEKRRKEKKQPKRSFKKRK